jgi:CRISPR-associated protein Cas8a1/Csx13
MEEITIDLFEPGMSVLHRAGLGGLACTLNWIEKTNESIQRPPGSWEIDGRRVMLRWEGGAEGAEAFFDQLYKQAFRLDDGLIDLPGSYWPDDVHPAIKAELQQGMSQTILQFGPNRKARSKTPKVRNYDVDGQPMIVQHQDLEGYTHQLAWKELVTPKGALRPAVSISGTIAPGFVQRHVIHATTTIEQTPGLALALHFALVGTLSLSIDRQSGVMVVPDVQDLNEFIKRRQLLNPRSARGCQVNSPADAALQAEIRLRAGEGGMKLKLDRCEAVLFANKPWIGMQKARASVLDVCPEETDLDLFEEAMKIAELQPRLAFAKPKKGEAPRPFWSKGVVRPLIAENLARHQPWYQDFRRLIVSADSTTDEDRVRFLSYETKGLQVMIKKTPWQDQGEQLFVESVHEAMRGRFRAIYDEPNVDPVTAGNRIDRQRQRWRLKFAGAKTPDDLRAALADLWSRSDFNPTLQAGWRTVLPLICDEDRWQLTRDLALLALSSYMKAEKPGTGGGPDGGKSGPDVNP